MRLVGVMLMWCALPAFAQQQGGIVQLNRLSSLRSVRLPLVTDTLRLDSMLIAPGTLRIQRVADTAFRFYPQGNFIVWVNTKPSLDSVTLTYRALPEILTRPVFHKDAAQVSDMYSMMEYGEKDYNRNAEDDPFAAYDKLEYNGSYSRAISAGNNQDVVLNSALNLQVEGYLLDSIRVQAAITDNTIPFQPEGNTQRIQEFDQIYVRLSKNRHSLQIGDYNLEDPKGYFLNYFKRAQGIYYQHSIIPGKSGSNGFGLSASIAKGQFARNIFQGEEGNQGPYKLTGNNGEQFFIILAATERVYVNGVLMERGEQADYIINYNTAEIRFMPRRLITKDVRIQVEFEYQDRNYLNSLLYAYDEFQVNKKWNLRFNAYSNQDAKNQPYQQTFNGEQKRFLSAIGDSIQDAYFPVIALDTFAANKILYRITDTVVDGINYDSVFVYSTNASLNLYSLGFAYTGPGRGDYNISASAANGRVYDWAAPVNGVRQGSYTPAELLITPKMQQVFTLGSTYQIDSLKVLYTEAGLSNYDPNTFSPKDNNAHLGIAGRVQYKEMRLFAKDSAGRSRITWSNDVSYEYVQHRFRSIAPYRNVEFGRDWNVNQLGPKPDEHLASWATQLATRRAGITDYAFSYYSRGSEYKGTRHIASYNYRNKNFNSGITGNLVESDDTFQKSTFFRPSAFAEYTVRSLNEATLGTRFYKEYNAVTRKATDTLIRGFQNFETASAYFKTPEEKDFAYGISYTLRRDFIPVARDFRQSDHSHTADFNLGVTRWENHELSITATYRKLILDDSALSNLTSEETGLGRITYNGSLLKNAVQFQTIYEAGSGQEQKRAYTYIEVPAGQGQFTWNDYNSDGVQQANEFEIAIYEDQKRFIRINTLTNEYVGVNYTQYTQSLTFEPANLWRGARQKVWQKLISRFSDQAALQINNRLLQSSGLNGYNPFYNELNNDNIIATGNTINNTLYFNRSANRFGIDWNYLQNSSKQLLTYGVEGSNNKQHSAKLRLNIGTGYTINLTGRAGERAYNSALDDGRSYRIGNSTGEASLTWLYRSLLRITGTVRIDNRANEPGFGGQSADSKSLLLDMRFTQPAAGAISLRGTYSNIKFAGTPGTSIAFILLDALQPGANYLWYASWERRVGRGIEMSLEYEGRKPGTGSVIHTGRMSLRAIL